MLAVILMGVLFVKNMLRIGVGFKVQLKILPRLKLDTNINYSNFVLYPNRNVCALGIHESKLVEREIEKKNWGKIHANYKTGLCFVLASSDDLTLFCCCFSVHMHLNATAVHIVVVAIFFRVVFFLLFLSCILFIANEERNVW